MNIKHEWNNIPISDRLDETVAKSLGEVKRIHRRNLRRRVFTGCAVAAAAFTCVVGIGLANPALAAELPLIGHLFADLQDDITFKGDYSDATPLAGETDAAAAPEAESGDVPEAETGDAALAETAVGTAAAQNAYTKTAGDLTVSLSEVYCNDQALSLTVMVHNDKEAFPETMLNQESIPIVAFSGTCTYSFCDTPLPQLVYPDGKFLDDQTWAGVLRFDLSLPAYDAGLEETPDSFQLTTTLDTFFGYLANPKELPDIGYTEEELAAMDHDEWTKVMNEYDAKYDLDGPYNEYENYWYDGPFTFDLDVTVDASKTQTRELNETYEGATIHSISVTPYEVTLDMDDPTVNYFPCLFDADGKFIEYASGPVTTYPASGHNLSTLDLYLVDYDTYMDIKGQRLDPDFDFKSLVEENALYHTTVSFQ